MDATAAFVARSVAHLEGEYLPRLDRALESLPDEDLWWKPHEGTTSVGVLLRHLEGNVRQWILSGLAGDEDHRERAGEFAGAEAEDRSTLQARLRETVEAACAHIRTMDDEALGRTYEIQGVSPTGLSAIYHVVEHFSWHTGQITWIAKARAGAEHGIAFYDEDAVNRARNRSP